MELNVDKIKRELKRINWTYARLAKESKIGTRQAVFYYFKSKSMRGAEKFFGPLQIDEKDLLK